MTTPSTERKAGPFLGTGVQIVWPFTFKVFAATDLAVAIADSQNVETVLVYGVDYSVALNANQETSPGGGVTYPISGTPLPVGSRLVVVGNLPYDQPLDLPGGGNFRPQAIENQLDRTVMQIQQLREESSRAVRVPVTSENTVDFPTPTPNTLLGFDALGNFVTYVVQLGTSLVSLAASGGAALIGFVQAGAGALAQTVQSKLRQTLSANDFSGVDPTGFTDSTAGLRAVFDYAIPLAKQVVLDGRYRISGPIQSYATVRDAGGLHVFVVGRTLITVDAGATPFADVLCFQTSLYNSASILGGELNIDGSNKAARGITIRHNDTGSGGDVRIEAKLKLVNFLETVVGETRENCALQVYGLYGTVKINAPYVYSVNRTNPTVGAGSGACSGIAVANCSGSVEITDPWVERVLCGPGAAEDGDGVKVFGANPTVATEAYVGSCVIRGGYAVNCQGRSFKLRGTSVTLIKPRVRRTDSVTVISQGLDIDCQACVDATIIEPEFEYFGTLNVAPFPAGNSFTCIGFQQTVTNIDSNARCVGGSVVSNVSFARFGLFVTASGARNTYTEFSGCKAISTSGFVTTMATRAWVEFDAAIVNSKATSTKIVANRNQAPLAGSNLVGYVGLGSPVNISQLSWEVCENRSSINGAYGRAFHNLSGSVIRAVANFAIYGNHRIRSLSCVTAFDFNQATPGSSFIVDLAAGPTVTNPPPWGSIGYALVEILDNWDSGALTAVRVTVNFGLKPSERFYTYNSGGTWASDCIPARTTAQLADVTHEINTQNKLTGLQVINTTTATVMYASASTAAGTWAGAGSVSYIYPA